jgi:hypothetical protein
VTAAAGPTTGTANFPAGEIHAAGRPPIRTRIFRMHQATAAVAQGAHCPAPAALPQISISTLPRQPRCCGDSDWLLGRASDRGYPDAVCYPVRFSTCRASSLWFSAQPRSAQSIPPDRPRGNRRRWRVPPAAPSGSSCTLAGVRSARVAVPLWAFGGSYETVYTKHVACAIRQCSSSDMKRIVLVSFASYLM